MPPVLRHFQALRQRRGEAPAAAPAPHPDTEISGIDGTGSSLSNTPQLETTAPTARSRSTNRLRDWIERLQSEPQAEAQAAEERRARLLEELSRAVQEAPDDMPIGQVIRRLNRHEDD